MAQRALPNFTPQQYLARELHAEERSEYRDGAVLAMSGGSLNYGRLVHALGVALGNATEGTPCESFGSEIKLRVEAANAYYCPDAMVVCGPVDVESETSGIVRNPIAIFEVLSPGTQRYDQKGKFPDYQTLPSLELVVFVWSERRLAERYERQEDGSWRYVAFVGDVRLPVIRDIELDLARLYARLDVGE